MSSSAKSKRLSTIRRVLLLAGGGALIAAVVLTLQGAIPRQVTVVVRLADDVARQRPTRTIITSEGETIVEAQSTPSSGDNGTIRYQFWLSPRRHTLEVSARGCPEQTQSFDPSETDYVTLAFSCENAADSRSAR